VIGGGGVLLLVFGGGNNNANRTPAGRLHTTGSVGQRDITVDPQTAQPRLVIGREETSLKIINVIAIRPPKPQVLIKVGFLEVHLTTARISASKAFTSGLATACKACAATAFVLTGNNSVVSNFTRVTGTFINRLRKSGRPLIRLNANGSTRARRQV